MPELPEVQTIVDELNRANITGMEIRDAHVFWQRTIHGMTPAKFQEGIRGRCITKIHRRGKFIVFDLTDPGHLLIHLRMTGRLLLATTGEPRTTHQHVILDLPGQHQLRFQDPRKFGRFYLVNESDSLLSHLGPEPLAPDLTARVFADRLRRHRRMLKPLLLDQKFIAGLGNIYVDEALWTAALHPQRRATSLNDREVKRLHRAIRKVLRLALHHGGTTFTPAPGGFQSLNAQQGRNKKHLNVFRRTGHPCPRCHAPIIRMQVSQRGTHICPICQCITD